MDAFLGTGLLGSGFIRALLKKGKAVNVWNRTAEKAKSLEFYGAKSFLKAEEAVKNASRIHLALSDDTAVDSVLEQASSGFSPGAYLIDHTTTCSSAVEGRTEKWEKRGFCYVHAPVFMGPQNALDSSGIMMVSAKEELFKILEPELSGMTGKLIYLGPIDGRAAGMKLLGNLFLLCMTAGIADILRLAKALDIPSSEVAALFDWFNPGALMPARVRRIIQADFDHPSWELKMARKDAGLMMNEASAGKFPLAFVPAVAKEMDRWMEMGMAEKDWTIIAKDGLKDVG